VFLYQLHRLLHQLQEWEDEFVSGEMEIMKKQIFAANLETLKYTFLFKCNKCSGKIKAQASKFVLKKL
jgi:hypothetical protein